MKLRIVSLNLEHGGLTWQPIIDFLRVQNADIILMQEAYNGSDPSLAPNFRSVEQMQRELPGYHADFAPSFNDPDRPPLPTDRGNLILSRFPITGQNNIFFAGNYEDDYHDRQATSIIARATCSM